MRHFSLSVDIAAQPQRVYEIMLDVERWSEWTASITGIKALDGAPPAVGKRYMVRQPKLPPALWTMTKIEPGRGFVWTAKGPGFTCDGYHMVEVIDGGSRATLSLEYKGLLGGLLGSLSRKLIERYVPMEAAGLKQRAES